MILYIVLDRVTAGRKTVRALVVNFTPDVCHESDTLAFRLTKGAHPQLVDCNKWFPGAGTIYHTEIKLSNSVHAATFLVFYTKNLHCVRSAASDDTTTMGRAVIVKLAKNNTRSVVNLRPHEKSDAVKAARTYVT